MHGEGSLHSQHARSTSNCSSSTGKCNERAGHPGNSRGREPDAKVPGKKDDSSRPSASGLLRVHDERGLGCRMEESKRRTAGDSGQSNVLHRTSGAGCWEDEIGVAPHGAPRTTIQPLPDQPSANRTGTIQQTMCPGVGKCKSCLRQGSGCVRVENADYGKGAEKDQRDRGGGTTQAQTPQKRGKRQGQGRRPWSSRRVQMTDASAEQCASLDDFCGGRNVGKKLSQSDFPSVGDPFAHESYNPLPDLTDPNKVFNPVNLASLLVQEFWKTPSALTSFAHASLGLTTCTIPESASNSLWPVPLPRRWTVASRLSPRRRRRKQYYHVRQQLLEIVVICLNWETLGFPCRPPPEAMRGGFISTAQHGILEHLETCLDHFLHMSPFTADDLGRSAEKFQSVITNLKELPKCKLRLQDLEICLRELHSFLDPYSSHFKAKADDDHSPEHQCDFSGMGRSQAVSVGSSKAVVSDRVKWENPPSFRAEDFLSGMVRAAYDDPEVMRKPHDEWTSVKPGRMHCSKEEFLKLVSRWDSLGACRLVPFTDQDPEELVGLFCVAKDSSFDRLIINPRVINSRMDTISDATKELAPGSMLGLLHLGPNDVFRFSADDLSDFYYTFKVGEKRALRNTFKLPLQSFDVCHLTCFDPKQHQGKTLLVCLSTLAMGDNLAVEIAQSAHKAVLSELCGSMLVSETLRYRCPIPRSDFIELLAIDDHVGIQKLTRESLKDNPCLRDSIVFENAEHAYKAVGLIQHPKKRKRNLTQGTILGADFDGVAGRVMAPRSRVLLLSIITLAIAHQGTCTPKLLSILLGSWIHVLLFRRVMFALMDRLFHEGSDLPPDQIFCLSRRARTELQLLGSLGSLAQADLRAQHSSKIYCTDASPSGGP